MRIAKDQAVLVDVQIKDLNVAGRRHQKIVEDLQLIFERIDLNVIDVGDAFHQFGRFRQLLLSRQDPYAFLGEVFLDDRHVGIDNLPHPLQNILYIHLGELMRRSDV